jgi:hypothetical protein
MNAERTTSDTAWPQVTVAIRGDQRTFEARETLKRAGLRWNPTAHAWWGSVPVETANELTGIGLPVLEFIPDEHGGGVADPVAPIPTPALVQPRPKRQSPTRRHKLTVNGPTGEVFGPREFDDHDVVANLPDDSREEEERNIRRYLRDLRLRVKAVRALLSTNPSIGETLATNPEKARAFYAIHHVTEAQVKGGVPDMDVEGLDWEDVRERLRARSEVDWNAEEAERASAVLPSSEMGAF